eukprot:gb/GEZJ01001873.1/.p1 GENE.gb/GEZJ01001873.1/~~gb/GEZJ01001873.1/.p1  ORF type:complete len:212 (+),score=10.87 gb/GEZJ01001873.1/:542-1177(+)
MQLTNSFAIQYLSLRMDVLGLENTNLWYFLFAICVFTVLIVIFVKIRRRSFFHRNRSSRLLTHVMHPTRAHRPPPPVYRPYSAVYPRTTIFVPVINHVRDRAATDPYNAEFTDSFGSPFSHDLHLPHSAEPPKEISLRSFQAKDEDKRFPCPICLDPLEAESVSAGHCNHMMHTSCLKGWLAKDVNSACPICRAPYEDFVSAPSHSRRLLI